jgi:Flp pilus assembly protein TadG
MTRRFNRGDQRGQTLVEFALILPVFILLLVGIFDFGRAIYANNTISNASREAVRLAIVDQNITNIKAKAVQRAASLGLTAANVTVGFYQPNGSPAVCVTPVAIACDVQVTVTYSYSAATPILSNLVGVINMSSTSREPVERSYETP